ncbi:MAG: ribonuclease HII [bacterium]
MWICGIDETGRGSLAGPLCVVAFCSKNIPSIQTKDSKKLSPQKRYHLFEQIISHCLTNKQENVIAIKLIDNVTIDKINILNANLLGFKMVIQHVEKKIKQKPDIIYIDGNRKPKDMEDYNIQTIVKADSFIRVVQIASIIAKVIRDRLMEKISKKYPLYGFEINRGYYDKRHEESIRKFGPCPIHRKTFIKHFLQQKLIDYGK